MTDLLIRIKKKTDGAAALSCVRANGTTTWQRQEGQLGAVFPPHDLTHLAVESVLAFDEAFYGLIAGGWDISSFADPAFRGRLPLQAQLSELVVGFFDLERITGDLDTAAGFNARISEFLAERKLAATSLVLTDDQLERIRAARRDLLERWKTLPAGDTLELSFERTGERSKQPAAARHKFDASA